MRFLLPVLATLVGCGAEPLERTNDQAAPLAEATGSDPLPLAQTRGILRFETTKTAEPIRCASRAERCTDVDRDGLVDAWEDAVLARFQPRLELDEQEEGLDDPAFRIGVAGRVVPREGQPGRVLVYFAFVFSEDYGACGFTKHHGDVERAVLELERIPGTTGDARLVRVFTAAHEGNITDRSEVYEGEALGRELEAVAEADGWRWLLQSSRNKHGTYVSKSACESRKIPCLADYCGADTDRRAELRRLPPLLNAGEPDHPRGSDWSTIGYPGASAWSNTPFCGTKTGGDCDSAPRESLLRDPF